MAQSTDQKQFARKVWVVAGIFALSIIILLILKSIFSVLLLLLGGAIVAIYFKGLASLLERKAHLPGKVSLPLAMVGSFLLLIGFFWLTGNKLQDQMKQLADTLPAAFEQFKEKLSRSSMGQQVLERANSQETIQKATSIFQSLFRSTFGVIGDIYIILLVSVFFTINPKIYTDGIIKMIPPAGKEKAEQVLQKLGVSLRKWLKGQIMAMGFVFVLSSIGLIILGVPMWLVLALIAGLLNFIPNFGPLIALIPAVLVGLMQDLTTAIIIAIMYTSIQVLESSTITPQIQQKLLSIPPALLITVQVLMGVLTGGWGVILATPLLVVMMVMINELYVKRQNA